MAMGMPHAKTNGRAESLLDPSQHCKAETELSRENEISEEVEDRMNGKSCASSSGNITLWECRLERVKWSQTFSGCPRGDAADIEIEILTHPRRCTNSRWPKNAT